MRTKVRSDAATVGLNRALCPRHWLPQAGMTALIAASLKGRATVVRLLLLQGADALATDDVSRAAASQCPGHLEQPLLKHMQTATEQVLKARFGGAAQGFARAPFPPPPPSRGQQRGRRACTIHHPHPAHVPPRAPRLRPCVQEGQSAWDRASSVRCREALAHTEPLQRWHRRRQLALWAPQREAWEDDGGASLDGASPLAASQHVHWEFDV